MSDIPDDVWNVIAAYLPLRQALALRLVSRTIRAGLCLYEYVRRLRENSSVEDIDSRMNLLPAIGYASRLTYLRSSGGSSSSSSSECDDIIRTMWNTHGIPIHGPIGFYILAKPMAIRVFVLCQPHQASYYARFFFEHACEKGYITTARFLLPFVCDTILTNDIFDWARNCFRLAYRHLPILQFLHAHFRFSRDDEMMRGILRNTLRHACDCGYSKVAKWLVVEFSLDAADAHIAHAFMMACHNGHLRLAKWLDARFRFTRASIIAEDTYWRTCEHMHIDVLDYVRKRFRLSRSYVEMHLTWMFHRAVVAARVDMVRYILRQCPHNFPRDGRVYRESLLSARLHDHADMHRFLTRRTRVTSAF